MSNNMKTSPLSAANLAMRSGDLTKAIALYQDALTQSPLMREQIEFNIAIAQSRIERSSNTKTLVDRKNQKSPQTVSDFSYTLVRSGDVTPSSVRGHIDVVDDNYIQGWIYDLASSDPVQLALFCDGKQCTSVIADINRSDVQAAGGLRAACGFRLEHGVFTKKLARSTLTMKIVGDKVLPAFSQNIEIARISAETEILSRIAREIKRELFLNPSTGLNWLSAVAIPELLEQVRNNSLPVEAEADQYRRLSKPINVDVIIPVYEGLKETINCIDSVLKSKNNQPLNLIVINDCSPNKDLSRQLELHAKKNRYTLIVNKKNLGFVGTVNTGIRMNTENDVILLNSDTVVPNGWLDQLVASAYSDPIIGTVTPFSNNATICSFPNFCQDNDIPSGEDVESLNTKFRAANSGKVIDLPTAHGFCMFIKRQLIEEIGNFDENKWGKGYAEENDFSLRADKHGWRNVMATDTFVHHLGSVSFAASATEFVKNNLAKLNGLYPDYSARVADFISRDPARAFRNNVSRKILLERHSRLFPTGIKPKSMLFVTLTIGGGTQIATDEISSKLKKEGVDTFYLTCPSKNVWRISHPFDNEHLDYIFPEDIDLLASDLKSLHIKHINYHNTIEFNKDVWHLPTISNCLYDVTIHDYLSICPRVNLVGTNGKYCGEPNIKECNACITKNGVHESSQLDLSFFQNDVANWRDFFEDKLRNASNVIVPNQDVAQRLHKYFPDIKISVRPHPEKIQKVTVNGPTKAKIINVAFLGAIGVHKGYDYLLGCADYAIEHKLPIHFHVIGYTKDDVRAEQRKNITVHGRYEREELPTILKRCNCTIAALLSVWPETFSYTFSEAIAAGLKIIAFNIGAPSLRLQEGCGELVDLDDDFGQICKKITALAKKPQKTISIGTEYENYLSGYFNLDHVFSH